MLGLAIERRLWIIAWQEWLALLQRGGDAECRGTAAGCAIPCNLRTLMLRFRGGGNGFTGALILVTLSKAWLAVILAAPVMGIIAYCANYYFFDSRSDLLRRVTAVGIACGVGTLFLWVHLAVLDMACNGIVPIPPGRGLGLVSHHAFRYEDTPILFWAWLVLDVFVVTAFWLGAIIAGARVAFGPSSEWRARSHSPLPSAARLARTRPTTGRTSRPFPLNLPGACIGVSIALSVAWVHAGLVG